MTTAIADSKGKMKMGPDGKLFGVELPTSGRDSSNRMAAETSIQTASLASPAQRPSSQSSSSHELSLVTEPSVTRTRVETDPGVTTESDHEETQASPAQRLGGPTPVQKTTNDIKQTDLSTPTTSEAVTGFLTQQIGSPTEIAEDTWRQAQHHIAPRDSLPQARRVKIGEFVQSLNAVDLDPDEIDTFVAFPYEPATSTEKQGEQPPRKAASATRPFILRRSTEAQKRAAHSQTPEANGFADRYDYLKKYPEDPPEEAMGPNARVWRVYLDEAEEFDIDMVDGFKDTVDVILVFAGLFSAVVTTFVVQASTALQLDYNQVMASILIEQLEIQRAIANGRPAPEPSPTALNLESTTTTSLDRWTNGLWFVSLSFSLATALFAVLVKQWIQAYVSPVSGPPHTKARVRHYRFMGLEKWHVPLIVGLLPTLLHLSLLLFFMGLVFFLFALDSAIAGVTLSITTMVYLIYVVTNLAPLFNTQCPYKTPLSIYALLLLHSYIPAIRALSRSIMRRFQAASLPAQLAMQHVSHLRKTLHARLSPLMTTLYQAWSTIISRMRCVYKRCSRHLHRSSSESMHSMDDSGSQAEQDTKISGSMKACELEDIAAQGDATDAKALCWVVTWSSNPSVKAAVIEAVCDLPLEFESKHILRNGVVGSFACASMKACTTLDFEYSLRRRVRPGLEDKHFRSSLIHFQLGWCYFRSPDGVHIKEGTARHVPCIYDPDEDEAPAHDEEAELPDPYFSLLVKPSRGLVSPQYMLELLPPKSPKIVFLLSLRRAALQLRTTPSSRSQDDTVDWPSCQNLFALVQLEPPPADPFSVWQTTLVSVYLASLVPESAPISEDSGLLRKLLFNHIELGSSELSQDLALSLSLQSCMEFLPHVLKHPTASTIFSSSRFTVGGQFIESLGDYLYRHGHWVSDPDKVVIGPHHTLLIALLDRSEKYSAPISAELRRLTYNLGYNLMARHEPQSSDPELDLVSLWGRVLRAALLSTQLPRPYRMLQSQLVCLRAVLFDSPAKSHSILTDIFRVYDGITTLEKIIQQADWQLGSRDTERTELCLEFYLKQVSPTGENNPASPGTDITQHGGQSDASSQDHLGYILQHLVQVIRICVACYYGKISHSKTNSYPDTLHILRRIIKTRHEALLEWNHMLAELESEGFALPVSDWTPFDVEHNLQEIISILRSDLAAAHSSGAQALSLPERPIPPRSSISISEATETSHDPILNATVGEENQYPTTCVEPVVSRSTRRFRAAVWGVIAARRVAVGAILPLHYRTPLAHVQEHGPRHSAEGESLMPRRDEEEGLDTDESSTRPA